MLTSSLLLVATSSRHADVIIAEFRFLFASNPSAFSSRYADVIIVDTRSCATDSRHLLFIFFQTFLPTDFIDSVPDHIFT
ncbi:hypothetical protein F511_44607 [Dorcoceras hygrometricum]|uniref:Uncharacterized protein n=1 Tax=Dorcoceras hygrometricum TaxID=472368 RepID=A0A2Z7B6Z4_9LAMI|nr:hypothetical protein F511_44607 [Dorcoceras hygrometricum]